MNFCWKDTSSINAVLWNGSYLDDWDRMYYFCGKTVVIKSHCQIKRGDFSENSLNLHKLTYYISDLDTQQHRKWVHMDGNEENIFRIGILRKWSLDVYWWDSQELLIGAHCCRARARKCGTFARPVKWMWKEYDKI